MTNEDFLDRSLLLKHHHELLHLNTSVGSEDTRYGHAVIPSLCLNLAWSSQCGDNSKTWLNITTISIQPTDTWKYLLWVGPHEIQVPCTEVSMLRAIRTSSITHPSSSQRAKRVLGHGAELVTPVRRLTRKIGSKLELEHRARSRCNCKLEKLSRILTSERHRTRSNVYVCPSVPFRINNSPGPALGALPGKARVSSFSLSLVLLHNCLIRTWTAP